MKKNLLIISLILVIIAIFVSAYFIWNKFKTEKATTSFDESSKNQTKDIDKNTDSNLGTGKLLFGLMVHVEGWSDNNPKVYLEHSKGLENYASIFEKYHAKLTIEPGEDFIDGSINANDDILGKL
jgi:H+/gluconate symporter-like permease